MRRLAQFIAGHGTALFAAYCVLCLVPMLILRTEYNAPFAFALRYLAGPIVALCLFLGLRYKEEFIERAKHPRAFWLILVVLPPLLALLSGGLVTGANALIPPQQTVVIQGTVRDKWVAGRRTKSLIVEVVTTERPIRFEVNRAEYEAAKVGQLFRTSRTRGPLGFFYSWK